MLLVLGVYPPVFTSDLNYMVSLLIPKSFVQLIILLFAAESMWQVVACQLLFSAHEAIYLHMHLPEHLDLINFGLYTLFIWLMIFIFATRFFNLKRYFFLMFWKLKTIKKEYDDVLGDFPEGILIARIEEEGFPHCYNRSRGGESCSTDAPVFFVYGLYVKFKQIPSFEKWHPTL